MNLLGWTKKSDSLSPVREVFTKNTLSRVWINCFKSDFKWDEGQWNFVADVEFKNGNTKGEQKFKAESFDDLLIQVKAFIEGLK